MKEKIKTNSKTTIDTKLTLSLNLILKKLEAYFPEHKVFALDAIDSTLREKISEISKKLGYANVNETLHAYGFDIISNDEVNKIRNSVIYTPGNEPEIIRPKVQSMLSRLNEYYPDKRISRSIQSDHKNLSQNVSGIYRWLGYSDATTMLEAYGYKYEVKSGGRPSGDYDEIIDYLIKKYKNSFYRPKSISDLILDNPKLSGKIKSLQNNSSKLFGTPLKEHFISLGILSSSKVNLNHDKQFIPLTKRQAIESAYSHVSLAKYGTIEEALASLENMVCKINRNGQLYIDKVKICNENVTIPYGVAYISDGAFKDIKELKELNIQANLTEIRNDSFAGCSSLSKLDLPEGIVSIGDNAFAACTALTEVCLPKSLKKIGSKAFSDCINLKTVVLKNKKTIISDDAFSGSAYNYEPKKSKQKIKPKTLNDECFEYFIDVCGEAKITKYYGDSPLVEIPSFIDEYPIVSIGQEAFKGCESLVKLSMSDNILNIQKFAFMDCTNLMKVHLSNKLSAIGTLCFKGCIGLTEINIPDSVTEIKKNTFIDSPLEELHIGKSLQKVNINAFIISRYDLDYHILDITKKTYSQKNSNNYLSQAFNIITVDPENPYIKLFKNALLSKDGKNLIAYIGNNESFDIPEGVEVIEKFAFNNLHFFKHVSFPDSLVEIKESAFENCGLTSVDFNEGIERIGNRAFADCPIHDLEFPQSLKYIGSEAFGCLNNLWWYNEYWNTEITVVSSSDYIKINNGALYIQDGKEKYLNSLFARKHYFNKAEPKLNEYVVEQGTTKIFKNACQCCDDIGKFILPDGLSVIENEAFSGCYNLKEINIPATVSHIGNKVFYSCSNLTYVEINLRKPENGVNSAVVYIPYQSDIFSSYNNNEFLHCFYNYNNDDFSLPIDFERYDNLFDIIKTTKDKFFTAVNRLKYPVKLSEQHKEMYTKYLRMLYKFYLEYKNNKNQKKNRKSIH